ncbi:MAG: hypothetical protein ACOYVK_12145 [Bacillota bacterium]
MTYTIKQLLPMSVFIFSLSICFIYMNLNPMLLNMSIILTTEKLGNAAVAGMILSMYTVRGIIGGAIFGKVYKMADRLTIPLSLLVLDIGLGISNFFHNVFIMSLGCTVAGIGFFTVFPAILMEAGRKASLAASAMVSAMILGAINFGGFFIGLLAELLGNTSPRLPILAGTVIILTISLSWEILVISRKKV